jgi:hypothetical protein
VPRFPFPASAAGLLAVVALVSLLGQRPGSARTAPVSSGPVQLSGPDEDNPPVIQNSTAVPIELPPAGGEVQFTVEITDDFGISLAYLTVVGTDSSVADYTLEPRGVGLYGVSFNLPANFTNEQISYTLVAVARDTIDQETQANCGEVTVKPQEQFDEFPAVGEGVVEPRILARSGGDVQLSTTASDDRSVHEVIAVITAPDASTVQVPLEGIGGIHYAGTFHAPANTGTEPVVYTLRFAASDDIGQMSDADGGTITVTTDGTRPSLRNCRVTPRSLPARGGTVTFRALAHDDSEPVTVEAQVQVAGALHQVQLHPDPNRPRLFAGTYRIPRNAARRRKVYRIAFQARDALGNTRTVHSGAVTVAGKGR